MINPSRRRNIPGGAPNHMPSRSDADKQGNLFSAAQADGDSAGLLAKKKLSNSNALGSYMNTGGSPIRDSEKQRNSASIQQMN